jgi:holo-[acyl-carrier protein] synthase
MILGIGTDIVEVSRIQASLERFGRRFVDRILNPNERDYCLAQKIPAPFIAARFAAKEAVSKAFGTGMGLHMNWHNIEICRSENGQPFVALHGTGKTLFSQRGVQALLISLSHTANYATAVAILEGPSSQFSI